MGLQKRLDLLAGSTGAGRTMWIVRALSLELRSKNAEQHQEGCASSFSIPEKWHHSLRLMALDFIPAKGISHGKSKATHPGTPIAASYLR
jgi:hypothetical protein